eukprot:TRINITY_DN10122_c0_g1_i1.p1 TRINITY_DN10122_c0_g1~~TRINITY_DN10122_c0_g1_i1.p1  ORF type:complete len:509 (+),score=66.01 TRINITY_DN10122_c0_g1_i1:273-1799(+)
MSRQGDISRLIGSDRDMDIDYEGDSRSDGLSWIEEHKRLALSTATVHFLHCAYCDEHPPKEHLMKCSQCKVARYCNIECQKKDWKKHKSICIVEAKKQEEIRQSSRMQPETVIFSSSKVFDFKQYMGTFSHFQSFAIDQHTEEYRLERQRERNVKKLMARDPPLILPTEEHAKSMFPSPFAGNPMFYVPEELLRGRMSLFSHAFRACMTKIKRVSLGDFLRSIPPEVFVKGLWNIEGISEDFDHVGAYWPTKMTQRWSIVKQRIQEILDNEDGISDFVKVNLMILQANILIRDDIKPELQNPDAAETSKAIQTLRDRMVASKHIIGPKSLIGFTFLLKICELTCTLRDYDQALVHIEDARTVLDTVLGSHEAAQKKLEELLNAMPSRKKEFDEFRTLLAAGAMLFAMHTRCLMFRGRFQEAHIEATLEFYMCTLLHETGRANDAPEKDYDTFCVCCASLKEFNRLMWPQAEMEHTGCVIARHASFTMSPPFEFLGEANSAYMDTLKLW